MENLARLLESIVNLRLSCGGGWAIAAIPPAPHESSVAPQAPQMGACGIANSSGLRPRNAERQALTSKAFILNTIVLVPMGILDNEGLTERTFIF